ncbi:TetR/AcrR family transcriptional regulator [Fulvivirga sedimenti]|uniref:TetR/AcrR family transcriptional regulator n=1 Tax=Fulvivirga sedimenti TaxID=2879465 RepID=A0A9X1KXL7_9BACT|nr:TetR/AcrR family transcriptional regulator [Fulvivirga sedimenti]MCA6074312.1 TetR/AcrR family transcriptional regulator [Fulvivirga sedimenti]
MTKTKTPDKRTIRKERTKEAIKKAALEIARKEGWNGVTIRKIAGRIDYTAPIVYEHFRNKDDLYFHLVHEGFTRLKEETFSEVEGKGSPEEKFLAIAEVRFWFAVRNPTLHHMMFDAENPDWQKIELAKSMVSIMQMVDKLVDEISGQPEKRMDYIFNMICLIKGYTFFTNHLLNTSTKMSRHFPADEDELHKLYTDAIRRFISSISKK